MHDAPAITPIPADIREAFERAVAAFYDWDCGGDEPLIFYQGRTWDPFSVEMVCRLVMPFSDTTPENVYTIVFEMAEHFRGGQEALGGHACDGPTDHSYGSVARCLLGLYHARKAYYRRKAT